MRKIPIFVINLEKSQERREFIRQQFNAFPDIEYQFFKAVDGKKNQEYPLFRKYNKHERLKRKGNVMSLSQLGCWASHYHLWEKCIELNQSLIILEDDAIIHSHFSEVYNFICSEDNTFEFFWLSPPASRLRFQKGKEIFKIIDSICKVEKFYKDWGNTTGYFITPKSAKKLLNTSHEWIYEVDITMGRYWESDLDYLAISPFSIEPNLAIVSNIFVDKGKSHRTLTIKIRREFYKLKDIFNKFFYNLHKY